LLHGVVAAAGKCERRTEKHPEREFLDFHFDLLVKFNSM
jgi:hypothetical protein